MPQNGPAENPYIIRGDCMIDGHTCRSYSKPPGTARMPPGAVRTSSGRRPEPYHDCRIRRENACESDCS